MKDEKLEFEEEVILMEDKKIKVKFTSTQEEEFENVLGQLIMRHSMDMRN